MQGIGYFKLYRELYHKPIWCDATPEQKVILITLLGMANYKEMEWEHQGKRYTVKPGQFVTSIPSIINECGKGISEQNVRTALKRFEKCGFLTDSPMTKNKNRLITIVNWEIYQGKNEGKIGGNLTDELTDRLTDNLTDNLTDSKNAENIDSKGIEGRTEKELTDTLTDDLTNLLTDDLNPSKEVNKLKNKNTVSSKPDNAYPFAGIIDYLNSKCGTKFKSDTQATQLLIKARYKEGYELDDFKRVIDIKTAEWLNTDMQQYLRPPTLFGSKFESYLNQPATVTTTLPGDYIPPKVLTIQEDTGPNFD